MAQWRDVWPAVVRALVDRYGNANAVADALGVNRSQVSRWLKGGQAPGLNTLQRIADVCPEAAAIIRGMF